MPRSPAAVLFVLATLVLAVAACSDGDGGDDGSSSAPPTSTTTSTAEQTGTEGNDPDGTRSSASRFTGAPFSIAAGLAELPASLIDDGYVVLAADLDAASELAGVDRSAIDPGDRDSFIDGWVRPVTGSTFDGEPSPVAALLPEAVSDGVLGDQDGLRGELGFSLDEVSGFIELSALPARLTILNGTFDAGHLQDVLGEPSDGYWSLGGDDFERDLDAISDARPIGEALRLAARSGQLAVSRSTPPIEAWLQGDGGGDTLADHESLLRTAEALDDAGVYTAMLIDGASQTVAPRDPAQGASLTDTALDPYAALGVGLTVEDGQAVAVFVYEHANEDLAQDNADRLAAFFDDDVALQHGERLSTRFGRGDVRVDGRTVVLRAAVADDARPADVWVMATARDRLTASR